MEQIIKYLVVDVDGTMTDSGIYYDAHGNEIKKFSTRDAVGFYIAQHVGIRTIVLTGRESAAVERRMTELKVDYLFQGVKNKRLFLEKFIQEHGANKAEFGYVGDDLNDLAPMQLVGFRACPRDSCEEIKKAVDYVSTVCGGEGVIRDVMKYLLKENKLWDGAIKELFFD